MHVTELTPLTGAVSWTDKAFVYYVHTIDRTLVSSNTCLHTPAIFVTIEMPFIKTGNMRSKVLVCSGLKREFIHLSCTDSRINEVVNIVSSFEPAHEIMALIT